MKRTGSALLSFNSKFNLSKKKKLRDGLSVVVQVGDTLWVANDETVSLERLTRQEGTSSGALRYGGHAQFALGDYLRLPAPPPPDPKDLEEADVEGLDYHEGYFWLVGSHSLKRKKADEEESVEKNFKRLAKVSGDGNRFLLARVPVAEEGGTYTLRKSVERGGRRLAAAQLRGDDKGNDLMDAVRQDPHLRDFVAIPGKDNGFDIEGLAVVGERLFIGLRGPVLRGWAVILEVEPEADGGDDSTLKLKEIGPGGRPYRKHFVELGGLGVRDLSAQGSDLLILAGPTMDLDGPVTIFRWPGGAEPRGESLVFGGNLEAVLDVPYGRGKEKGTDHAEGMTLFSPGGGPGDSLLVVYDSAAESRRRGENGVEADIFAL
jgi:hypothetical protein